MRLCSTLLGDPLYPRVRVRVLLELVGGCVVLVLVLVTLVL